jgi:phage FluMu protein Com
MKTATAVLPFKATVLPFPLANATAERCPRCHRGALVRVGAAGRFDWVKCHRCNQVISTRSPNETGPRAA